MIESAKEVAETERDAKRAYDDGDAAKALQVQSMIRKDEDAIAQVLLQVRGLCDAETGRA